MPHGYGPGLPESDGGEGDFTTPKGFGTPGREVHKVVIAIIASIAQAEREAEHGG